MEKREGRAKRGQVTGQFIEIFIDKADSDLIKMLSGDSANERTAAAVLLGNRKCILAVGPLCKQLTLEKSLYSKIAISEALGKIGEPAVPYLIALLGKIGNNQHKFVPEGESKKKSYPLPRDIAARTITKVGTPALKYLEKEILSGERESVLEALDAYGFIAYYNHYKEDSAIIEAYNKYKADELIIWKIIRSFQAFPTNKVQNILRGIIDGCKCSGHQVEAKRTLLSMKNE